MTWRQAAALLKNVPAPLNTIVDADEEGHRGVKRNHLGGGMHSKQQVLASGL